MVNKSYLVAYDISSDKRRAKFSGLLERYGTRVNKSVFICIIDTRHKAIFLNEVAVMLHRTDEIICIPICQSCEKGIIRFPDNRRNRREASTRFV